MRKTIFAFTILGTAFFIQNLYAAKISHSAVMSPSCSQQDIKAIAGDALKHISDKKEWEHTQGYNIKLDEKKMTMGELTKKMFKKGCFQKKKE